jgi:hypothetical protein
MSWFANNLYAKRTQALEDALRTEFPGSVYRIDNLKSYSWWRPEIIHGVPDGGLLSVRPFSNGDTDCYLHKWYDESFLNWNKYANFGEAEPPLRIPPEVLGIDDDTLPPPGFLRYLRHLSKANDTPLLYYQCFMWGGSVETEFAFVYFGDDEYLYSLAGIEEENEHLEIRHNSSEPQKEDGDVLVHALRHIGLELPTPYFAPHTSPFDWGSYRVGCRAFKAIRKGVCIPRWTTIGTRWAARIISNLRAYLRCEKK